MQEIRVKLPRWMVNNIFDVAKKRNLSVSKVVEGALERDKELKKKAAQPDDELG